MRSKVALGIVLLSMAGACASSGVTSKDAADAEQAAGLNSGTTVCISELVGVRFALEDMLKERDLAPERSCMFADVQMKETGEARAWVMSYQRVGDSDWKHCKSSERSREAFAEECIGKMVSELGGS